MRSRPPDRPRASSEVVRRRMQATLRRDTPPELALRSLVHGLGLRFRVDWPLPGLRRRADLAFVRARLVVFVDGCFWHGCPQHGTWPKAHARWWRDKLNANRWRDADTDRRLRVSGWAVIRMWAHDDPANTARKLARIVRARTRTSREP
ncbi:MAG: very short patch repair endonuclease [Candidatus Rokuibacteriota bacterium]